MIPTGSRSRAPSLLARSLSRANSSTSRAREARTRERLSTTTQLPPGANRQLVAVGFVDPPFAPSVLSHTLHHDARLPARTPAQETVTDVPVPLSGTGRGLDAPVSYRRHVGARDGQRTYTDALSNERGNAVVAARVSATAESATAGRDAAGSTEVGKKLRCRARPKRVTPTALALHARRPQRSPRQLMDACTERLHRRSARLDAQSRGAGPSRRDADARRGERTRG